MALSEINQLKNLDFIKQLAFAYLTCERLYPNYVYFSNKYGFGNSKALQEAIAYLNHTLFDKKIDTPKIVSIIKNIEDNIPQTADYDTILASSALDACTAVIESLSFLIDKQVSRLENISTMATDTVAMYIHDTNRLDPNTDKDFQQKIDSNPLMKKELAMQKGIISYLSTIDALQPYDINTLVHLQENNTGSLSL